MCFSRSGDWAPKKPDDDDVAHLLLLAFSRRIATCYDVNRLDRVTKSEASADITRLSTLLKGRHDDA